MINVYKIVVWKPKMKIPLGRLRHAWEDVKIKWSVNVDWIQLAEYGMQCLLLWTVS